MREMEALFTFFLGYNRQHSSPAPSIRMCCPLALGLKPRIFYLLRAESVPSLAMSFRSRAGDELYLKPLLFSSSYPSRLQRRGLPRRLRGPGEPGLRESKHLQPAGA
jgi:hypothetical protein